MIRVNVYKSGKGKIRGFKCLGHAEYADAGEDIVCAAVSALTETALLGIGEYLHRNVDYDLASGKLIMKLKDSPDSLTEAILQTMSIGLEKVAETAPQAVKIRWEEE